MAVIPNLTVMIYVVVSLVLIAVLVYLLVRCQNKSNFCTCSGMDTQMCADPQKLKQLYAEGKMTEYTIPPQVKGSGLVPAYDAFVAGSSNSRCY